MLQASVERILDRLGPDDIVLDVGAWGRPFTRADWVLDLMPYATRGLYGRDGPEPERFTEDTWLQLDVCDRTPWPFEDDRFDFAVCSQTLEDVRDPVWVCSELSRVAKAGYVEVPSRLEEQSHGVSGPTAGWTHHRWLCDVVDGRLELVFKHAVLETLDDATFSHAFYAHLTPEQRVLTLWWEGRVEAVERVFVSAAELDPYLREPVLRERGLLSRLRRRAGS
jgi:Methyltransferase domain